MSSLPGTPHLIVYHSARPLGARLAAALHLRRLPPTCPPAGELAGVLAQLAGPPGLPVLFRPFAGLRLEGWDAAGRRVFAAAPGAAPDVAGRAMAGLCRLAGADPEAYLLAAVPEVPWPLWALAGLGARPAAVTCARLAWPRAAAAVAAVAAALGPVQAAGLPGEETGAGTGAATPLRSP